MYGKNAKPYNFVEDYGFNYRFALASDPKLNYAEPSQLLAKKYFQNVLPLQNNVDSFDEASSSSDTDSEENDFMETHHCQIYSCQDPECYSCERSNDCNKCDHCGINKSLQLPCFDCNIAQVHATAQHYSVRCGYHKEFPKPYPKQFDVVQDPAKVIIGKFSPIYDEKNSHKTCNEFLEDKGKLESYIACKVKNPDAGTVLLQSVLDSTYSQCHIGSQLEPQVDLDTDISRFLVKTRKIPIEIKMPGIKVDPSELEREGAVNQVQTSRNTLCDSSPKDTFGIEKEPKKGNVLYIEDDCCCIKPGSKQRCHPKVPKILNDPCVLCNKEYKSCSCHQHRRCTENRKKTVDALVANHRRGCLDTKCPLRSDEIAQNPITKWFDTLVKLERVGFKCPLNEMASTEPGLCVDKCGHSTNEIVQLKIEKDDKRRTFVTNYLPRPLSSVSERRSGITKMKLWDRLCCFQETFTDHALTTHRPLISGINKPIYDDNDEAVRGKYDDVYQFWDRNRHFTPKKILVKKPETLVKLIGADDLPLKFEVRISVFKGIPSDRALEGVAGNMLKISQISITTANHKHVY